MRCYRVDTIFRSCIVIVFLTLTAAADDAFDKLFSAGKYKEAIAYADEKMPVAERNAAVWSKLGVAHEEQQMVEKALACYMVSIRLDQKNYESHLGAARIYNKMGQADKALELSKKAMELKPTGEASWTFAQACITLNRVDEAKSALEKVVEVDPSNTTAQRALGNLYYKEKKYAKAVRYLKKAYASKPDGETALDLANAYKIIGNLDSAAIFYKEASRDRKSAKPEATIELARIYYKKGKYDDAAEEYEKANQALLTGQDLYNFATSIEKIKGNKDTMIALFEAAAKKAGDAAIPDVLTAKEKIGRYRLETKKYQEALYALEFIRKKVGDAKVNPDILFLIAEAHDGLRQRSKAIPLLEAVIARDNKNIEAYARLADIYAKDKQTEKAKGIYEKLLSLQPNSPSVYQALGEYNLKAKKYADAMKHFQKSFTLDQKVPAALGMMKAAWELKKYDIARDAAESALHKDKKLREPQIVLARIYFQEKNFSGAAAKLEGLLNDEPKNLELLELLAQCYEQMNKKDKLAEVDKRIIDIDKKNIDARLRFARFSQQSGDVKTAKSILDELIQLQPKNTAILKSLYEISLKTGDKKDALRYLTTYLGLKPSDAALQKACGDLLYESNDKAGALSAYRAAIKIDSSIKGLYKRYAELVMAKKSGGKTEQQEVINVLNAAIKAGEADAEIYATLGSIYKTQGVYVQAIDMFQKALQKNPKDVESLSLLAYCQEKAGKNAEAIISYEQAAVMNAGSVKEYKSLGDLYMKTGKKEQAVGAYKKYLEKTPDARIAILVGTFEYDRRKFNDAAKYYAMVSGAEANNIGFLEKYAEATYQAGDMKKAEETLRILTIKSPQNPEPFRKMYEITLKADRKNDAANFLQKYTALKPRDAASLQNLGDLYYELKNPTGAIAAYRNVLKADPKAKGFYKKYLELVATHGTPEEKTKVLNNAINAGEADAGAYIQLGTTYMKNKNYARALHYFEKASQLDPKSIIALKSVAECQSRTGATAAAILTYEQVVALDPNADDEYKQLGDLYTKQNKTDNAVTAYKKYLDKKKDDAVAIFIGDAALKKNNYSEAITYYDMAKGKEAQSPAFLENYGEACLKAKNDDKAFEIFKKFYALTPQNAKVLNTLFEILFRKNQKDEALVFLKKYVVLKPADAKAQKTLGDMLYARKDKTGATAAYQAAVKANPGIKGLYKNYAELIIETGKEDEIGTVLSGAVAAGEADVNMYKMLGSIYLKQKKYDQAIPMFEKASQLEPQNVQFLSNLADAQAKSGNNAAAILTYEQVIALNPNADDEYKALGDLYKAQKKNDLAIKNYKKYLEKKSDNAIAREIGQYSFNNREYAEAVKYFDRISGPDAGTAELLKIHAEAALLAKDDAKAFGLYKRLSALEPGNAPVLNKLYRLSGTAGTKDDVLFYLKKYTALQPSDAEAQKTLGDLCYEKKDTEGALTAYRAVFKVNPKTKGLFKNYAVLVMAAGKDDEIIPVLSGAVDAGEADVAMYKRLGAIYLGKKNYPAAMSMLERASQLEPKNVSILEDLAKTQVAAGNITAAILTYEQVVAMNPQADKQLKELGNLYWQQKKTDQAIKIYTKYLEKTQDNQIAKLVGQKMYDQRKYPEAMKYLSMVTGADANDPKHLMLYGQASIAAKDEYKAFQLFKQLANVTPKDPDVFEKLYDLAQRTGTKDEVLNYLRTYTALKPSDAKAQKTLGDLLLERKDDKGALNAYRAALKADPAIKGLYKNYATLVMSYGLENEKEVALQGAVASGEADAKMYATLGDIYTKKGLPDKAITAYDKASRLDPKNDKLLSALALNQVKKGSISEAIGTYEQVIALNPRAEGELKALGNLYLQQKKDSLALNCFKRFLDKRPGDSEVSLIVGEASLERKNYADAARYFSMVKGDAEKNASFIRMYGDACYESKDNQRALVQYQKLAKLTPKDATVYKRLYEINLQSGAKRDALNSLRAYVKFRPKDAKAQKDLGGLLYDQGDKEEALTAYRNALTADPKIKGLYKRYVSLVLASPKAPDKMRALNGAIAAGEADASVYKTLGGIYADAKKYSKAAEMYREAVKLDNKDASLYLDFADCLIKTGDLANASANLEKALQLNPAAVKEFKLLGDLNMKQKKTDDAIAAYKKYLAKAPGDEEAARIVADYAYRQKKYGDAYKYYSMIKKNNSPAFLVPYGMCALQSKDYPAAITILEKVRLSKENVPERDVAYKSLAEAYEKSGNPRKAAEVLYSYVKLPGVKDPDAAYRIAAVYESINLDEAVQMYKTNTTNYPKDHRNFLKLGLYYAKQKNNEKSAIPYLEKSIALVDSLPDVLLQLGTIYSRLNRNDDMLRVYRKLLEIDSKNAPAMADIGELLLSKNLISDALIFLEMANAEVANNPKYMTLLARGYLMSGQQREGARLLEKVVREAKGSIDDDLRMTLADVYIATREYKKAADELEEVMKKNKSPKVMMKYAETLIAAGKPADALKIAEQIKAKEPENIEAHMMIGKIKVAQKKYNDAIETYKEILYMDQNYAPALCERANVYLLQGKLQWAETFYDRALKADPQNALVYLGLARLAKEKKDYASYSDYLEKGRKIDPQNREIQVEMRSGH
ncbi:MAG: tetratricopeptide repeat protein [Chitinispirillaceae bacterium]|nr:tetratricopeptide repeat protein [Chitinispirillaceae bacterium]